MYYNVHRWHETGTGRYTRPDPMLQGGLDFLQGADYETLAKRYEMFRDPRDQQIYTYAQGRPTFLIDLLGLYGTTDCSYYDDVCRADPNCRSYYCGGAQAVCKRGFLSGKIANCVRLCLQEFDQRLECPERDCPPCAGCIVAAHVYCFVSCTDDPDRDPVP